MLAKESAYRRHLKNWKIVRSAKQAEVASIRNRIQSLITSISGGMYEREEIVSMALLGALCGQSTFLYGPPGTAKSLIARRVACAFDQPAYFEYLMNRFSTPDEVFGPVSIKALKEDRYIRKTDGYLPKADFAFLDEIWKASPAILNTLLTLINERIFKNGDTIEPAPLKALIAASNETPEINQGLDALFDRFTVRLMVAPISQVAHFENLIASRPAGAEIDIPDHLRVQPHEWSTWLEQIHMVSLSPETLTIVHLIRAKLAETHDVLGIYMSDRRWQRASLLMRASAFFNGRRETNHSDALLLQHCIWTHQDNHQAVTQMVTDAVHAAGISSGPGIADMDGKKEALDREITNELFYSSDVYKSEKNPNGEDVFKVLLARSFRYSQYHSGKPLFLPTKNMKSVASFSPLDESGNRISELTCAFDGQGTCKITEIQTRQSGIFTPEIQFHKGDKKSNINERLVASMAASITEIKSELISLLNTSEMQFSTLRLQFASLFTPVEKTDIAIVGIAEQIDNLKLRIMDCERLEGLCR